MDNATKYEILNKNTGATYEVEGMSFGHEIVTVSTSIGYVVFTNKHAQGDLQNEEYAIREIGTNIQADGIGTINDIGVETE